jgi:putative ABC transport system ATP-binding protein
VKKGEFVSIMGPSGSGKSTLLHFLGFLDKPTSGEAMVEGIAMSKLSDDQIAETRNDKVGFVFQTFNLAPSLSVLKNVELPLIIGEENRWARQEKAKELLKAVGLSSKMRNLPSQLSGGERQRVAIARALAKSPDIILADEPTGNLDSVSGKEVMEILYRLWKNDGKTVLIVTHEPVVAGYARRTIHIRDGKIEKDVASAGKRATENELKIKK